MSEMSLRNHVSRILLSAELMLIAAVMDCPMRQGVDSWVEAWEKYVLVVSKVVSIYSVIVFNWQLVKTSCSTSMICAIVPVYPVGRRRRVRIYRAFIKPTKCVDQRWSLIWRGVLDSWVNRSSTHEPPTHTPLNFLRSITKVNSYLIKGAQVIAKTPAMQSWASVEQTLLAYFRKTSVEDLIYIR